MKTLLTLLSLGMTLSVFSQLVTQPIAARYLPLGTYSKNATDIWSARSNAAALAHLQQSCISLYTERRFALADLSSNAFSAGFITQSGALALHVNYFGFSLFHQSELSLAYGMKLNEKVDAGIQFNYYRLQQGNGYGSASSINAAAGAIFHLTQKVHAGIHIYNPLGSEWSKTGDEKIPAQYTLGIGYEASEKLLISSEIVKVENTRASVNAGVQYRFLQPFFGRMGISTATNSWYGAAGFIYSVFRIDIAASYHPQLGISPAILVLFNMGKKRLASADKPVE